MTRTVLLWMIPVDLLLVAWVWIGRVLFGVGGWMILIYLISVVPVLLVGLLVTSVLALTQSPGPDGRRRLTDTQAKAQLWVWGGMFVFGTFSFDFGDTDDSDTSLLIKVLGDNDAVWTATTAVMGVSAVVTIVAWIALVATLTAGRRPAAVPSRA